MTNLQENHANQPETEPSPKKTELDPSSKEFRCEKCEATFDYECTMRNHNTTAHPASSQAEAEINDPKYDKYDNFEYFGDLMTNKEEIPIASPVKETIVSHTKLKITYMNVNSLVSPIKKLKAKLGIEKSKSDIIILAETKLNKQCQDFQIQGYYLASQLTRKSGAGGLLVMAKSTIKIHSVVAKNILPEIQVITFVFNGYTFITVYRSPSMSLPAKLHHKTLIGYLNKQINKLNGSPYVLVGDFNLPHLAACDFNPPIKINDFFEEDFDEQNISVDQMWSDFFHEQHLDQWVTEPTFPRHDSILDLVMAPIDQDIYDLKVDQDLFDGSYDHYAVVFKIETNYDTDETQKTRRVTTKENWDKFLEYLIKEQIMKNCPKGSTEEMARFIVDKIMEAYNYAIPIVPIKPPPPGGYLQRETKKFIKKATRFRRKLRRLDPESEEYIQLKAKLKILNKCCENMIKRDRITDQVRLCKQQQKNLCPCQSGQRQILKYRPGQRLKWYPKIIKPRDGNSVWRTSW